MSNAAIILKPGRDKSVVLHHPWIFDGAVMEIRGAPALGDTVEVLSAGGVRLGWAAFSPHSKIMARLWTADPNAQIDEAFLLRRVRAALARRAALIPSGETDAMRLVYGESDGLPGLVVDRYAGVLVMQCLSAGSEKFRMTLAEMLAQETGIGQIYERSDAEVRRLEGLEVREGPLLGAQVPEAVVITENGLRFGVDVAHGQKTGFYIDQRRNRARVGSLCQGKDVLNCFCYTGAFSIYAAAAGAKSVLSLDSSADALAGARRNADLNGLDSPTLEWMEADVFKALRTFRDARRSYDLIILDPPKFAPTAAQAETAARGYKDINLLALKLLRPGGLLATFSCSGGVNADLFQKILAGAALDAGVDAVMVDRLSQGVDHPVALHYPEGTYLKGLILQVSA